MSVLKDIAFDLDMFVYDFLGEERVHELAGQFLGSPYKPDNPFYDRIDNVVHGSDLFQAWLWFDYRHKNRSLLEWFAVQSTDLPIDVERRLQQLIESQHFSLYKFGATKPGNIECIDLNTNTHFHVREYSLATQIKTGQVALLRICRQDEHWEIVMPNGSIMPITINDPEMLEEMVLALPKSPTMKDTPGYRNLLAEIGLLTPSPQASTGVMSISKEEALKRLNDALHSTGVSRYLSIDKVTDMMQDELHSKEEIISPPRSFRILIGLAKFDEYEDQNKLMEAVNAYWNSLISKKKLPKFFGKKESSDIVVGRFSPGEWLLDAEKAHEQLTNNNGKEASRIYDEMFKRMLEQYSVTPSIYRLVTNAAVAQFASGELLIGTYLLNQALKMCPDYDFAVRQKELLESGYYDSYALSGQMYEDEIEKNKIAPTDDKLRLMTDSELKSQFESIGVDFDLEEFNKLAGKYTNQYDVVDALKTPDSSYDYVYGLLDVARERWASSVIWVDTLHGYCFDLDDAVYGSGELFKKAPEYVELLKRSLEDAKDVVIKQWMNGSRDYADSRQNIVLGALEVRRKKSKTASLLYTKMLDLCELAYKRTKDPVYQVPALIDTIVSTDSPIKRARLIEDFAAQLPLDHVGLQMVGDELRAAYSKEAALSFELAIEALDHRRKKQKWQYLPYSYTPLADEYEYIAEQLDEIYPKIGQQQKATSLNEKLVKLFEDDLLFKDPITEKITESVEKIVHDDYADSHVVQYIDWFNSLGIDLLSGDGNETRLTTKNNKIGRNDPCPCGAVRPNGKPMKYKKCHGE